MDFSFSLLHFAVSFFLEIRSGPLSDCQTQSVSVTHWRRMGSRSLINGASGAPIGRSQRTGGTPPIPIGQGPDGSLQIPIGPLAA